MRKDSSPRRWVPVGSPENAGEAAGLDYIGDRLPDRDPFRLWTNFTFPSGRGRQSEVDALVLGPGGLYLVELKYWVGRITGDDYYDWTRDYAGRSAPERIVSPVSETERKAKELRSLLRAERQRSGESDPDGRAIPFVRGVVFLHHPRVVFNVPQDDRRLVVFGQDELGDSTGLPGIMALLGSDGRVTPGQAAELVPLIEKVISARRGQVVGGYLLGKEPIAQGPGFTDYIGTHTSLRNDQRVVRLYDIATVADKSQQRRLDRAAHREAQLGLSHPGISTATNLLPGDVGPALLYRHDPRCRRLDQVMADASPMPLEARLRVIRGVADVLRYAHDRGVTHRGLSPRSVLVPPEGSDGPAAIVTDWQTADVADVGDGPSVLQGTRNVQALLADAARWYRAPEVDTAGHPDYVRADVFSLGAIAYALFGGVFPADGPVSLRSWLNTEGGLRLDGSQASVPAALADLVYQATRTDAGQRIPDIDTFAALLHDATEAMAAARPDRGSAPGVPPGLSASVPGDIVAGRWRVIRELGSGSTARAFLVADTSAARAQHVLKVAHDPDADIRVREEAAILSGLDHPSIVRLVEGPLNVGGRAALVAEQAGERTLRALIRSGPLSPALLEALGDNLLESTAYLADRGVYHRDIKPANLGVRHNPERSRVVLFDFSHANVPLDAIEVGTVGYRDPFLSLEPLPGLPHRPAWDPAAELYAVAATLFEMATRTRPQYGDGMSDPQAVPDEAAVTEDMFPGIPRWQQRELAAFFRRALRRDCEKRFPSIAAMRTAWAEVFYQRPVVTARVPAPAPAGEPVGERDSQQAKKDDDPPTIPLRKRDPVDGNRVPAGGDTPAPKRRLDGDPSTVSVRKTVTSPPQPRRRPASSPPPAQPVAPLPQTASHSDSRQATGGVGGSRVTRESVFPGGGTPSTVLAAIWLMYAGAAASLVTTVVSLVVTSSQWWSDYPVSIVAWILVARACGNGWGPTRVVGSALFAIATLVLFGEVQASQSGIATICDVLVWLVGLSAVICLWRPSSTAFFRGLPENRSGLPENRRRRHGGGLGPYGPW